MKKQTRKNILLAASIIFLLSGCAHGVPGDTRLPGTHQPGVLKMLTSLDRLVDRSCSNYAVSNTEVVVPLTTGRQFTTERWTLNRCGTNIPYLVTFTLTERGVSGMSAAREK